ncbi:enoyl-CoA hydratase/isomerase family protein [Geoalkalibacter sp.]|uniref:enoyl-CoA hydratase/isomerase family protein n=1 Tax=Geoalkalibacter sp. TaxID=3041440 RepID=UPI00272EC44B|nr:enoyl-CoA hydratase/isomerase family protein [Geoalkalibacter sp.]
MNPSLIHTQVDAQGRALVTLNRPEVHNAFDDTLISALTVELRRLEADSAVRVVTLTGAGKSFSAGADLGWMRRMADYSPAENLADAQALAELMRTLDRLAKPTIALVQGPVYGGGVGLVACCDIALASPRAAFCLSEVKLGLIPAVISPYVVAAMGARAARRHFLTAERFSAEEALRLGLVHELVAEGELAARGAALAEQLLQNGPRALVAAKDLVALVAGRAIDTALIAETAERICAARASAEGKEGLGAFLEKRQPQWAKGS